MRGGDLAGEQPVMLPLHLCPGQHRQPLPRRLGQCVLRVDPRRLQALAIERHLKVRVRDELAQLAELLGPQLF